MLGKLVDAVEKILVILIGDDVILGTESVVRHIDDLVLAVVNGCVLYLPAH